MFSVRARYSAGIVLGIGGGGYLSSAKSGRGGQGRGWYLSGAKSGGRWGVFLSGAKSGWGGGVGCWVLVHVGYPPRKFFRIFFDRGGEPRGEGRGQ